MERILLYNTKNAPFSSALKTAVIALKIRARSVSPEQYLQPVGFLAGLRGFSDNGSVYEGEGFSEPMLVLCGFTEQRLNRFLRELRIRNVPSIPLKAVLTAENQNWDSLTLYRELKSEHEALHPQP